MRIAWVTPLDRDSAIGAFSVLVTNALRRSGDLRVDVWGPPASALHDFEGDLRFLDATSPVPEGEYDHIVYNLGNNPAYHTQIFEASHQRKGIVIMHDRTMLNFFIARTFSGADRDLAEVARFISRLGHYYGSAGLAFTGVLDDQSMIETTIVNGEHAFPMVEPCIFDATGVVSHSASALSRLTARYGSLIPSACLELPLLADERFRDSAALLDRATLGLPSDRAVVLSHGYSTAAKREHVLIDVIAREPLLRKSALLVLAGGGDAEYLHALAAQVRSLGLEGSVRFTGRLDDLTLYSYVARADICVNLRYPSTEAASASLGEQLHFARPTIVSNLASYAELPDDVVVKVDVPNEAEQLAEALRSLVGQESRRKELGLRAGLYARVHNSAERYAAGMRQLFERVSAAAGLVAEVDARARDLTRVGSAARVLAAARETATELAGSTLWRQPGRDV